MPDNNLDEQIPAPELSENQKYVNEKVATLIDQIGDEYGESLTQQLVQRLDATVTDFHEEVTNMLSELKERTVSSCLLYTSPSPRDGLLSRMPSSA